jgi:hypothetical protein
MSPKIVPENILTGLVDLDRETLASFLAIFEDGKATTLITDKLGSLGDMAYDQYKSVSSESKDRFSERIVQTAQEISQSTISDDDLRICLWAHLRDSFELPPRVAISPRDLKNVTNDIGAQVTLAVAQKIKVDKRKSMSLSDTSYWNDLAQDFNPFSEDNESNLTFEEAVRYVAASLFVALLGDESMSDEEKGEIKTILRDNLSSADQSIIDQAGTDEYTNEALTNALLAAGGLVGLAGAVELAGFGAYILAAKAAAIIPLVGAKALVEALFVLTHPLFIIPVMVATGVLGANSLTNNVRKAFATQIAALLALRGIEGGNKPRERVAELFAELGFSQELNAGDLETLSLKETKELKELARLNSNGVTFPNSNSISSDLAKILDTPISSQSGQNNNVEDFLFPNIKSKPDNIIVSAVTVGDMIFDLSGIDPEVIKAADFSYGDTLDGPFVFADFAEEVLDLSPRSIIGHEANLTGYTAERLAASKLTENGHVVSFPDSPSEPGYDLLVDGVQFQVKCIQPDNIHILETHFDKYPDIPVIVNSEIAEVIADRSDEWVSQVFFLDEYTYEFTHDLVTSTLEAGAEVGDFEIVPTIAAISLAKNAHGWWKGKQSLQESAYSFTIDTASKGVMALAGGFTGKTFGLLMFGPAGSYIFGGVFAVAASSQGHILTDIIDKKLDPIQDELLRSKSDDLMRTCNEHLEDKIIAIEKKMNELPQNELGDAMRYRWQWELVFVRSKINQIEHMIDIKFSSGQQKVQAALELSAESGVHPVCLQDNYKELFEILGKPKDRWGKTKGLIGGLIDRLK